MMSDPELDDHGVFKSDAGMMTLSSGRRVNPLNLTTEDVDILDIATALSNQCRYNGHVGGFLSVARHSIWVAKRVDGGLGLDNRLTLTGLLHDAAEAYLGDMIRPLKHGALGEGYLTVEARIEAAIADRFGLPFPWPEEVMAADAHVLLEQELGGPKERDHFFSTPARDRADFLLVFDYLWSEL